MIGLPQLDISKRELSNESILAFLGIYFSTAKYWYHAIAGRLPGTARTVSDPHGEILECMRAYISFAHCTAKTVRVKLWKRSLPASRSDWP